MTNAYKYIHKSQEFFFTTFIIITYISYIAVAIGLLPTFPTYLNYLNTFIHSNSTFSWLMSFFSQIPNKKRYIPCTKMYKGQELNIIDTNDIFIEVKPLTHEEVHHIQGTRKRVK